MLLLYTTKVMHQGFSLTLKIETSPFVDFSLDLEDDEMGIRGSCGGLTESAALAR